MVESMLYLWQAKGKGCDGMATILIVDDESLTREGIKNSIEWQELGINTVLTAKNGANALEVLGGAAPDILLTDVRMPIMDGIGLSQEIRRKYPDCAILFLSGYADEPYLRNAIEVKAEQYIDKPVDPDALNERLGEVMERIRSRRQIRKQSARAGSLIRGNAMRDIRATAADIEETLAEVGRAGDAGLPLSCILFFFPGWQESPPEELSEIAAMEEHITEAFFKNGFTAIVNIGRDYTANCFICHPAAERERLRQSVSGIQAGLKARAVAALGKTVEKAGLAPLAYRSAQTVLEQLYYYEDKDFFEETEAIAREDVLIDKAVSSIPALLRKADYKTARQRITEVGGLLRGQLQHPKSARDCFTYILMGMVRQMNLNIGVEAESPLSAMGVFDTVPSARQALDILLEMLGDLEKGSDNPQKNRIVEDALLAISKELGNAGLSITMLCDELSVSSPYLCFLFKQQTGETIKQYINRQRMEAAKSLIANPNLKIHEVAARCGFSGTNYFTRAFKKHEGVLPTQYRAEHQK
jgi:two-component system response regulator YesN